MLDPSSSAQEIITARLLVLQSKRLMLQSLERRLRNQDHDRIRERTEKLRFEVSVAHGHYRTTVLRFGSPERSDYWPIAYGRLVEVGHALAASMRRSVPELPPLERYDASSDVEMVEFLVGGWTDSLRKAMADATA